MIHLPKSIARLRSVQSGPVLPSRRLKPATFSRQQFQRLCVTLRRPGAWLGQLWNDALVGVRSLTEPQWAPAGVMAQSLALAMSAEEPVGGGSDASERDLLFDKFAARIRNVDDATLLAVREHLQLCIDRLRAIGVSEAQLPQWLELGINAAEVENYGRRFYFRGLAEMAHLVAAATKGLTDDKRSAFLSLLHTGMRGVIPQPVYGMTRETICEIGSSLSATRITAVSEHDSNYERWRVFLAMMPALAAVESAYGLFARAADTLAHHKVAEDGELRRAEEYFRMETWIAHRHAEARDFPSLTSDQPNPAFPRWQRDFKLAFRSLSGEGMDSPVIRKMSLRDIVPHQVLFRSPILQIGFDPALYGDKDVGDLTYLDSINGIRRMMLLHWERDLPPEEKMHYLLRTHAAQFRGLGRLYKHSDLPVITQPGPDGAAILIDAHHRLSALLSLVHDGLLPEWVLDEIYCFVWPVDPSALLQETTKRAKVPSYGWPHVLQFNSALVAYANAMGVNHDILALR